MSVNKKHLQSTLEEVSLNESKVFCFILSTLEFFCNNVLLLDKLREIFIVSVFEARRCFRIACLSIIVEFLRGFLFLKLADTDA